MGKNIVIFSDGTGQAGGVRPDQHLSNIYKLYRACRTGPDSTINPAEQVAFYTTAPYHPRTLARDGRVAPLYGTTPASS